MTTKRYVRYSVSAVANGEELIEDDSVTSEELKSWYEEDVVELLMYGDPMWGVDVQVIEREE